MGLAALVFSFGRWTFEGDDLRDFRVVLDDADPMPELNCESTAGFMEALVAQFIGHRISVRISRPERRRIVFDGTASAS